MNCKKTEKLMINFTPVIFTKSGDESGQNECPGLRDESDLNRTRLVTKRKKKKIENLQK